MVSVHLIHFIKATGLEGSLGKYHNGHEDHSNSLDDIGRNCCFQSALENTKERSIKNTNTMYILES